MRVSLILLLCLFFQLLLVEPVRAKETYSGYVSDVQAEKDERFYEIFIFATPPPKEKPLSEVIFNSQLSREFKEKYREKFGQLDTETIIYQPTNLFAAFDENRGAVLNIEQAQDERKKFGDYMLRRLTEWHVDNYFKTDPSLRPVYEMKEKLSHLEVHVTKQTKLNAQYSFSDNSLDIIVDNALFDLSKLTLQMNPSAIGPSDIEDEKLLVQKQIDTKLRVNTSMTNLDGIATVEFVRALRANWATSFMTTAAYKAGGPSPRETRYLVGLSHAY